MKKTLSEGIHIYKTGCEIFFLIHEGFLEGSCSINKLVEYKLISDIIFIVLFFTSKCKLFEYLCVHYLSIFNMFVLFQ